MPMTTAAYTLPTAAAVFGRGPVQTTKCLFDYIAKCEKERNPQLARWYMVAQRLLTVMKIPKRGYELPALLRRIRRAKTCVLQVDEVGKFKLAVLRSKNSYYGRDEPDEAEMFTWIRGKAAIDAGELHSAGWAEFAMLWAWLFEIDPETGEFIS